MPICRVQSGVTDGRDNKHFRMTPFLMSNDNRNGLDNTAIVPQYTSTVTVTRYRQLILVIFQKLMGHHIHKIDGKY